MSDRRLQLEIVRLTSLFTNMLRNSGLPTNTRKLHGRSYVFFFAVDGRGISRDRISGTIVGTAFGAHSQEDVNATVELQISNPDALQYGRIRCLKKLRGSGEWKIVFQGTPGFHPNDERYHVGTLILQ